MHCSCTVSDDQHLRPRPIMVVDDDVALREFVSLALADQGYRTITAGDGVEALGVIERETPALILIDKGMPHLAGSDLVRAIRAAVHARTGAAVPCILMSGSVAEPDEAAGDLIAAYLDKPFGLDDLLRLVERYAPLSLASSTAQP